MRRVPFVVAVCVLGYLSVRAPGQGEGDRLNAGRPSPDKLNRLIKLRDGQDPFQDADGPLLDEAAKFFIYRLTYPEYQSKKATDTDQTTVSQVYHEIFTKALPDWKTIQKLRSNQLQYMEEMAKRMVPLIRNVVANSNAIARDNAAMVLARLAEMPQVRLEPVAKALCDFLEDKDDSDQGKMVKFHALVGFKNLMAGQWFREQRDTDWKFRCYKVLTEFLERKPPKDVDPKVWQFIRREAIAALGNGEFPAILPPDQKGTPLRPALTLLRLLRDPNPAVPLSLSEKVEATVAVAQLKSRMSPANHKEYAPGVAAYYLGLTVVEIAERYAQDRENGGKSEWWKIHAARLAMALRAMADEATDRYVGQVADKAKPLLESIQSRASVVHPETLRDWLNKNHPADNFLFKKAPDTGIGGSELQAQ